MLLGLLLAVLISPERPIAPPQSHQPAIAAGGAHEALAVWTAGTVARAVHLRDGVADSAVVDVGPTTARPEVAFDGDHYLVVTVDSGVFGRRFERDGAPLDAAPFFIVQASAARVAFDGRDFVVAAAVDGDLVITRVGSGEQVPVHHPVSGEQMHGPLAVASNGAGSIVLWNENQGSLWASVVSRDGIATGPIFVADLVAWQPSIAWTGSSYTIAWIDPMDHHLVHWVQLDAAGTLTGAAGRHWPSAFTSSTAVARLSDGALIAWAEEAVVRGIRVGANAGGPFTIATASNPALASDGGDAQLVYERDGQIFARDIHEPSPSRRRAAHPALTSPSD
jgi:hypothetical protein